MLKQILILIEHQQNRQVLSQSLAQDYQVLSPEVKEDFVLVGEQMLSEDFDLCFIDFGAIYHLRAKMEARREAESPIFLPFVFLTTLKDVGLSTDHLEQLIDDLIYLPIRKIELRTKLRVLLRSRCSSLELQAAQLKLKETLIKEQDLNQLKSRFVSMVSHEFRNPLNSISGIAQIFEMYGDNLPPEKKAELLQQLQRNVSKMTNLLDNVLVIGRKDMGKLEFNPAPLNLEIFCRNLIAEVQTVFDHKQTVNFAYQGEQEFNLDSKLLHPVLTNLLSNACKYSPKDSVIDFEVFCQTEEIVFAIRDRGIGIPAADIPNLFNSFYRASNSQGFQGTGLGLAIAKEYIELHQGAIAVSSEPKVSTSFVITIPVKTTTMNKST